MKKKTLKILKLEQGETVNPERWETDGVSRTGALLTALREFLGCGTEKGDTGGLWWSPQVGETEAEIQRSKGCQSLHGEGCRGDSYTEECHTSPEGLP